MYPVKDLKDLETDEYRNIPVKSETLGEGKGEKLCFEVIEFGVRNYKIIDNYEGANAATHPCELQHFRPRLTQLLFSV